MTVYSLKFISFSRERMRSQGAEIEKWAKSDNPLLAQTCREIMEAAAQAGKNE